MQGERGLAEKVAALEREKQLMMAVDVADHDVLIINAGGTTFSTKRSTLTQVCACTSSRKLQLLLSYLCTPFSYCRQHMQCFNTLVLHITCFAARLNVLSLALHCKISKTTAQQRTLATQAPHVQSKHRDQEHTAS